MQLLACVRLCWWTQMVSTHRKLLLLLVDTPPLRIRGRATKGSMLVLILVLIVANVSLSEWYLINRCGLYVPEGNRDTGSR